MAGAAQRLLDCLTPAQRAKAALPFDSDERLNWKFVPAERQGLPLGEMEEPQRELTRHLLLTALSAEGYRKAAAIQQLETVLAELEKGKGPVRDPLRYHLTVFGQPGAKGAWAWRLEGHHLEVQVTLLEGRVVGLTPHFMGANPGRVAGGPLAGTEVLAEEDALGLALAASLTPEQARLAVLPGKAPADILSGDAKVARALEPRGIGLDRLDARQQRMLRRMLACFAERYRGELAAPVLRETGALPPEQVCFAWMGGTRAGEPHYYRIQTPTLLLELDNTQGKANHVHTVWRDLRDDFGRDALRRHLEAEHGAR